MRASGHNLHIYSSLNNSSDPLGQSSKPAGQQPCLKLCPPSVDAFTGREDVLAQMVEFFFDDSLKKHVLVLYGLGGAGKTQIALKFVEMFQNETVPRSVSHSFSIFGSVLLDSSSCLVRFSNVYFVDATAPETIDTELRTIALAKGIGEEDTLDWLARQQEEWLLLFNNADDPTFNIRDYFPRCSHGNILITTRNRDAVQHASDVRSSLHISAMDPNDATNLLLNISGIYEAHAEDTRVLATAIVEVRGYSGQKYRRIEHYSGAWEPCARCGTGRRIYIPVRMQS